VRDLRGVLFWPGKMALVINISAVPLIHSIYRIDTPGKQQAQAVGMLAKSLSSSSLYVGLHTDIYMYLQPNVYIHVGNIKAEDILRKENQFKHFPLKLGERSNEGPRRRQRHCRHEPHRHHHNFKIT
jgi:hypothetical protein